MKINCSICRENHEPRGLSFDGHGVNSCGMYRSRIATFQPDWKTERGKNELGLMFAAAPEMLEALELLLTKDTAMAERFGEKWPLDLSPQNAVNKARAAIAKAKGENQ